MSWDTFIDAIALVLIIEGLMPFMSPRKWRQFLEIILAQSDAFIRWLSLFSMGTGVVLLYIVRLFLDD